MILLFITLIRAVPMSQLNRAACCRSLGVGGTVPREPDAGTPWDDRGGGDAVNEVTSMSLPALILVKEGDSQPLCKKGGNKLENLQIRRVFWVDDDSVEKICLIMGDSGSSVNLLGDHFIGVLKQSNRIMKF